ncbi:F-BAR domain only protein 1 [Collichthys lucidus]|uniref:F-BAR domain only protein 1 n=1 Tax=Collichthys lucidus TaxID=240159 RepID=A0A4U5UIB0_COLLU|nr:F-BAR domain only protein 1 [Collichthys lucidus]
MDGEKNAGFDVLYHNMKHGQLATKELAEFVRESAAIEETYSKSMSKLAKMASNGSPLGTFAPMWDVFRVSSDKLALCHLELMRKMNDLIRDINKYGDEQVKIHRKAELKSKKAAESFALCIEKYNRVGGEFEQKMSESAQKFQEIEEAHLRQMKQLIKGYSHSIEDTHVQVGQVHEEFKQNVENIGIDNLIQKFAEQKGTGKERPGTGKEKPALVGFEGYMTALAPEGGKKSRAKAFRIPGLGKRDKEPDSTTMSLFSLTIPSVRCSEEKENNFYSSDSDFDDEEPKKFHIQIRPVTSSNRSNSAATEKELKATVGALTLPPNRGVPVKRHLSRNSSTAGGRSEEGEAASHRDLFIGRPCTNSRPPLVTPEPSARAPKHVLSPTGSLAASRLSSTLSGTDSLFGPPLESAFKSKSFDGREQLREQNAFGASEYAAFSSDSSSPENVEDSGLDSPSNQPLGPSPEPVGWAAWPPLSQTKEQTQTLGRPVDPFLSAFRDPSPGRSPHPQDDHANVWSVGLSRPSRVASDMDPSSMRFPAFSQSLPPAEMESSVWNCKHIPPEDPFLAAFERTVTQDTLNLSDAWARPPPRPTQEGRGMEVRGDPFSMTLADTKTLPTSSSSSSSSSSNRKDRDRKRDRSLPPPVTSDDPFAITMIGSPTHQSSLAAAAGLIPSHSSSSSSSGVGSTNTNRLGLDANSSSLPAAQPKKELMHWNSVHNPFSDGVSGALSNSKTQEGGGKGDGGGERRKHRSSESEPRRNAPPLTRHSGPQEDLCFSTDKDQDCLDLNTQISFSVSSHKGSKQNPRQDATEVVAGAPPRAARAKRTSGRLSGCERSRSLCSSPLPEPSPSLTTSSSSSSPSEWGPQARDNDWGGQNRAPSPARMSGEDHGRPDDVIPCRHHPDIHSQPQRSCAQLQTAQHLKDRSLPAKSKAALQVNCPLRFKSQLCFGLCAVLTVLSSVSLCSDPSQSDPDTRDFWFNMQALQLYLQREAELNPQASYYNVGLLKYQVSSQDPGRAPLLLSAECQRSGTVTRVSLDYHCCPATAPSTQLTAVQVLLPLDHTATDLQCQPPASWNAEERRLLWKLPSLSPTNHSKGSGTLCASWQCLEVPRGPPPSLAVQFVGSGASLSGMDVELVGGRYRMSLVKKRFATGDTGFLTLTENGSSLP